MSSPFEENAEEVRARVTTDHLMLRSLVRALVAVAEAGVEDERQRALLRDLLSQLCSEIEQHLAFEERALVPLLRDADAWGLVRVAELEQEHADQRAIVAALLADAFAAGTPRDLIDDILGFTARLERDIAEEERDLLSVEALGQRMVVTDQFGG